MFIGDLNMGNIIFQKYDENDDTHVKIWYKLWATINYFDSSIGKKITF